MQSGACPAGPARKSPRLPGCRRHEETLAKRFCRFRPSFRRTAAAFATGLRRYLKQSAVSLVVRKTGTPTCNAFSISSGTSHAAGTSLQWVRGRWSNDRAVSHSRARQRRHLRRARAGCLSHRLGRSTRPDLTGETSSEAKLAGVSLTESHRAQIGFRQNLPNRNPDSADRLSANAI